MLQRAAGYGVPRCRILAAPAVRLWKDCPSCKCVVRVEARAGGSQKKGGKSVVLPAEPVSAPEIGPTERLGGADSPTEGPKNSVRTSGGAGTSEPVPLYLILGKKVLRQLSSFPLAIGELFFIGFLSAIGRGWKHTRFMREFPVQWTRQVPLN